MMKPDCFLDTNILVYAFEPDEPDKQAKARRLVSPDVLSVISWQVAQEFIHVARHKFRKPLDHEYLRDLVDLLLEPKCTVRPTPDLWRKALAIQADTQYRFYDSLIVAAAIESGAPVLYSEDLQHGRVIGNHLRIINPFVDTDGGK